MAGRWFIVCWVRPFVHPPFPPKAIVEHRYRCNSIPRKVPNKANEAPFRGHKAPRVCKAGEDANGHNHMLVLGWCGNTTKGERTNANSGCGVHLNWQPVCSSLLTFLESRVTVLPPPSPYLQQASTKNQPKRTKNFFGGGVPQPSKFIHWFYDNNKKKKRYVSTKT